MATMLGSLLVSLGLESGAFKSGLGAAEKELLAATKRFEKVGQGMVGMGTKLWMAVTVPMIGIFQQSSKEFVEQEQAMAQVNAALTSMGDASGKTAAELGKTADALELNSLFDADVILKQVTANLLTFGNVAGEQFDRAQQAAVDMATRMGGEPQAAAIMLGKALNDPIKGIAALTRVGVQFTDAQKAQIKAMTEAGDVAGAQGIILAEVEKQFGGAAAAAADTSPWNKMQVALGQAGDTIGQRLLPMIKPVSDAIASMLQAFNNLSPEAQKIIVVFGAIAAVLGPVMTGVGALTSAMAPFIGAISAIAGSGGLLVAAKAAFVGLGAAIGPILAPLAALVAVGAAIYMNWDKIAPVLYELWDALSQALGPPAREMIAAISEAFSALWSGPLGDAIKTAWPYIKAFAEGFAKLMGGLLVTAIKLAGQVIGAVFSAIAAQIRFLVSVFDGTLREKMLDSVKRLYEGVKTWIGDKLNAVWDWVVKKIQWVGDKFFWLYDAVVGHSYIPDMVDGIAHHMARLDEVMVKPAQKASEQAAAAFKQFETDVQGTMENLFPEARELADFRKTLTLLDRGIAKGGAGGYTADQLRAGRAKLIAGANPDLLRNVALPLTDQLSRFGNVPLASGVITESISGALETITKAANDNADDLGVANVRIAKSFKDMADQTLSALDRMASAVKGGGFLDILSAVIGLGMQLGSIGLFGKTIQANLSKGVPGFANGTNFAPGGMAIVGERGPELVNLPRGSQVIPNHELGGGMTVQVVPSPYFDVRVMENIGQAAPGLAAAGAAAGQRSMAWRQSRRVA